MKDMVPKGTGNSRFLRSSVPEDITHEELVALLRAGTFPVDFAGLNPDGIDTQGSAYNKANVLPDEVCTSLGIPTSSEPKDAFSKVGNVFKPYKLLEKITSSKNWTCPDGVTLISVLIVGGGGGGGGAGRNENGSSSYGGGGQGGACLLVRDIKVTPGQSYQIVIGTGGRGGTGSDDKNISVTGTKGGDTAAFGFTAIGGDPGRWKSKGKNPAAGSFGGDSEVNGSYGGPNTISLPADRVIDPKSRAEILYIDLLYNDWYGSGGGGGSSGKGGPNAGSGQYDSWGTNATACFGGGGGGGSFSYGGTAFYSGGNGGSGAVLIYVRGD